MKRRFSRACGWVCPVVALIFLSAVSVSEATFVPPNDDCENATPVGDGVFEGDNTGTTTDGTASCGFAGLPGEADVWYRFTAPVSGVATIDTCGTPGPISGFDSVLSVFDACGGMELACNDDVLSICALFSLVELAVTEGESYWIRVAEYRGRMAPFVLSISTERVEVCGNGMCAFGETSGACPGDCYTMSDFAGFQTCFSGQEEPQDPDLCEQFDSDDNGFVDLADFAHFLHFNLVGP